MTDNQESRPMGDNEAVVAKLKELVDEAMVYREDKTTPECSFDSGPYCGAHSFLEFSGIVDEANDLLARLGERP